VIGRKQYERRSIRALGLKIWGALATSFRYVLALVAYWNALATQRLPSI
jgi:hypothetical protein